MLWQADSQQDSVKVSSQRLLKINLAPVLQNTVNRKNFLMKPLSACAVIFLRAGGGILKK